MASSIENPCLESNLRAPAKMRRWYSRGWVTPGTFTLRKSGSLGNPLRDAEMILEVFSLVLRLLGNPHATFF